MRWRTNPHPDRAEVGRDLLYAWEALECVLIRCGEVAAGQEFVMPGNLNVALAHAERGGYADMDVVRDLLGVRHDYLTGARPTTATMQHAVAELGRLERTLRERLGPLAPPDIGPKPAPAPPPKPL